MNKKADELLKLIPDEGFIKKTKTTEQSFSKEQKVALIRKGNNLFNQGKYELAKRIFLTTGYSDGLIRLGDYYYSKNQSLEALRMYYLAPKKKNVELLAERMASIIKTWLQS